MGLNTERIALLLLIAAVVSMLARKIRLPYTVGLIVAGLGIALLHLPIQVTLTKHLIFSAFLPPLIFEAAFQMPWKPLKRDLPVTLTLATLGVLIATGIVTGGILLLLHWSWQTALLMGVLISATDPVSVIATFKSAKVQGRIDLLVEAESLFNDGTAAVLFGIALAAVDASTPMPTLGSAMVSFLTTVLGGIACGGAVGGIALLIVGRTEDHLVEIAFTTVAAYGSFLLAEHFHLSGVLATLTAGVLMGNVGATGVLTSKGHEAVLAFWEYAGFVANSLIFLLIGMPLVGIDFIRVGSPVAIVTLLVLLGRAVSVYGCCALFTWTPKLKVSPAHQHVLFWGGLRGALALALVLGLPADLPLSPQRETLIAVAFGVVALSIVIQGVTMPPLLRQLGETVPRKSKPSS